MSLITEQYDYKELKRESVNGKRLYACPDGNHVASVTTILSKTKDMTHLNAWKKRVGEANAQRIVTEASGVGTAMHNNLERFLIGEERKPGNNHVHVQANKMADEIINNALVDVDEIWGIEQALYYPELYSGTCDVVGQYKGQPCIMDFKQTNKPKKKEWVDDYYMQLAAYAMAHNAVYGTDIKEGHIFMCSRELQYQQFDLVPEEFEHWSNEWLKRVEDYYTNYHK